MSKVLELESSKGLVRFKDKKEAYKWLDKHPTEIKSLEEKYILSKDLSHIKNIYQYVFNFFHADGLHYCGKCIICGHETTFNIATKKYSRLDTQACIDKYKAQFKERMNKVHGRDYFTQDKDALKQMLNNRSITEKYHIGDYTYNAVGKWEVDFLDFMFRILKCHPTDLIEAPFVIPYEYNGVKSNYFPDFFMPSVNLLIEIKASNNHYEKRDRENNEAKSRAGKEFMKKRNGHYFMIYDKNYVEFLHFLDRIVQ